MMYSRAIAFSMLAFLGLTSARAEMRASPFVELREARLRLLGERDAQGTFTGALEIRLAEGFKTYWKNAGDSGVPPHFDFSPSRGMRDVSVQFPLPQNLDDGAGGRVFGYKHDVMFVLQGKAAPDATLRLKLDFAVCGTLCIPLGAELAIDLDRGTQADEASVSNLLATRQTLPKALGADGVSVSRAGANEFVVHLPYAGEASTLQAFPDAPAFFDVKEIRATGPGRVAVRVVAQPAPGKATLGPLSLTYGTQEASFERVLDVDATPP